MKKDDFLDNLKIKSSARQKLQLGSWGHFGEILKKKAETAKKKYKQGKSKKKGYKRKANGMYRWIVGKQQLKIKIEKLLTMKTQN